MMYKSRKFLPALLALALGLILVCAGGARAIMQVTILEVTGILEEIDESVNPPEITLKVDGESASGTLVSYCVFQDEIGTSLSMEEFIKRYVNKTVTVESYEDSGEIVSCRAER